jgi:hypothetical protein
MTESEPTVVSVRDPKPASRLGAAADKEVELA